MSTVHTYFSLYCTTCTLFSIFLGLTSNSSIVGPWQDTHFWVTSFELNLHFVKCDTVTMPSTQIIIIINFIFRWCLLCILRITVKHDSSTRKSVCYENVFYVAHSYSIDYSIILCIFHLLRPLQEKLQSTKMRIMGS